MFHKNMNVNSKLLKLDHEEDISQNRFTGVKKYNKTLILCLCILRFPQFYTFFMVLARKTFHGFYTVTDFPPLFLRDVRTEHLTMFSCTKDWFKAVTVNRAAWCHFILNGLEGLWEGRLVVFQILCYTRFVCKSLHYCLCIVILRRCISRASKFIFSVGPEMSNKQCFVQCRISDHH
jgi:hypothetical protein